MKNTLFIFLFAFLFQNGFCQEPDSEDLPTAKTRQLTDEQLKLISNCAKTLPEQAQISFAIIESGIVNFYGVKKEKDSIFEIDNSTKVFEIGSITKVFTATLLANFVLAEELELDDAIGNYLDFSLKDNLEISFRQLATHTSGLPRVPLSLSSPTLSLENPYKDYSDEKLETYLTEKLELIEVPGKTSSYSNLGFGLLGYLMESIDNSTYEDLLQTRIFSKYQMKNSTTDRDLIQSELVIGLNDTGDEVPNWDLAAFMGAGGILSNVEDLSRFALAQFNNTNKELELTREKHFTINDNYSMGLAWGLIKSASGEEWDWHNGGTGGYTSSMILNTKSKNGIIIVSNISALGKLTSNITDLAPALMKSIEQD